MAMSLADFNVEDAAAELESRVTGLTSTDDWQEMLATAARFHSYSFNNVMLIEIQRPDATRVAGYRKWQSMGRQVLKGEKGIRIFAPMTKKDDAGDSVIFGFRLASVFDISQTEGDEIPSLDDFVVEIDVDAPLGWEGVVVDQLEAEGFTWEMGKVSLPGANGVTRWLDSSVVIADRLNGGHAFKTSIHELAHVKLHDRDDDRELPCRGHREVEAESVAFIVSQALGVPTGDYSFGYIASWAERADKGVIREAMTRVQSCAKSILKEWEPE